MKPAVSFSRRQFIRDLTVLGAIASSGPWELLNQAWAAGPTPSRLSYLSYRSTDFEGRWVPSEVEGQIPKAIDGTLYRIGPGSKSNYGTDLKHLFDGDAYVTAIRFQSGKIDAQSRFVDTEERQKERQAGKMIYHEFGTASPNGNTGYKRSPNIHVVNFDGKLLACSEAAAPVAVDPEDLSTLGAWNFNGTLPGSTTFTAHPKFDPVTGDGYVFGITQAMSPQLVAYRYQKGSRTLVQIGAYSMGGFYMVHDMMITENYVLFVIPPIYIDLWGAAMSRAPIADLAKFESNKPFRVVIMRKDGKGAPIELKSSPGGFVFHNGNAYEENGKIIFESILMDDMQAFEMVKKWSAEKLPGVTPSWITRFVVDLQTHHLTRQRISDGQPTDFPTVDPRTLGHKQRHLYALEAELGTMDPLALKSLVCWDLETLKPTRQVAKATEVFGEMVFAFGRDGSEYMMNLGYDSKRDQTFLDIRRPVTLARIARVWMGRYFPLGFHGSFV